ncbi:hypothetical protein [Rhizobium ecuadorense]|uniref:hypothetical protein n=1 Tax=Rhizobium ecuadorense TaxID=1671795 RepID=UPI0006736D19|nr:hypothetical protein [Rhizobium ecuadorense]
MAEKKQIDDGGLAFPGMSLRDYFAGHALAGMFRHTGWINTIDDDQVEVAKRAYHIADAMILARSSNLQSGE